MIDHIINSAIDSASPAITRWRIVFCFLSIIFFSPNYYLLFQPLFYELSVQDLSKIIIEIFISTKSWVIAIIIIFVLYIIPTALYYILRKLSSFNVTLAEPLIDELINLRKKPHHELEDLISTYFDTWKETSDRAARSIENKKTYCELSSFVLFFYIAASMYLDVFSFVITSVLATAHICIIFFSSRSILISYLKRIAPFKVLEEHIKYVVLVRENKQ